MSRKLKKKNRGLQPSILRSYLLMETQSSLNILCPTRELSQHELDLEAVEFHLDAGHCPDVLADERFMDKSFDRAEVFDMICELNQKRGISL